MIAPLFHSPLRDGFMVLLAGTPHDRAARNNKLRLSLAVSNSHDYMMEKQGLMSDEAGSNRLTQAKGLDAIVEDKIQMAIMRGDFDGLENKGKPLNIERNSLVNPAVEVSFCIFNSPIMHCTKCTS
jgi:Domain of unknown function (DUF1992)